MESGIGVKTEGNDGYYELYFRRSMNLKSILTIFAASLSTFLVNYMTSSLNLALTTIGQELVANPSELSLVPSIYLLGTSLFLIPLGRVSDIYGAKRVLLGGCAFFALTNVMIYFWAHTFVNLLVLRCLQGIAAAFVHVSHIPVVISNVPKEYRATSLGILAAVTYFGSTAGIFAGGFITEIWGWRHLFSSAAGGCLVAIAVIFLAVSGSDSQNKNSEKNKTAITGFDFWGLAIYAAALISLQWGTQNLNNKFSFLMLLASILALAAFIRRQSVSNNPIYDVRLFKTNRTFAISNISAFLSFFGTYGCSYLAALYLQCNRGLSPLEAGAVLFVQPAAQIIFAPLGGALADRTSPSLVAAAGMSLLSAAYIILAFISADTSLVLVYIALTFVGIGVSFFASPNTSMLMNSVPENKRGMASASLSVMLNFGRQFSMIFCGTVFFLALGDVEGIPPEKYEQMLTAIRTCYTVFAGAAIFTIFLCFWSRAGLEKMLTNPDLLLKDSKSG